MQRAYRDFRAPDGNKEFSSKPSIDKTSITCGSNRIKRGNDTMRGKRSRSAVFMQRPNADFSPLARKPRGCLLRQLTTFPAVANFRVSRNVSACKCSAKESGHATAQKSLITWPRPTPDHDAVLPAQRSQKENAGPASQSASSIWGESLLDQRSLAPCLLHPARFPETGTGLA